MDKSSLPTLCSHHQWLLQFSMKLPFTVENQLESLLNIQIEACQLLKHYFYIRSHSKGTKERALHVHIKKIKHFIATLFFATYS